MSLNTVKINNNDTLYIHSIFDISEYHNGATYPDLSSALAAVPVEKLKGGMTVRYILSGENTYVEFKLVDNTWSSSELRWENVLCGRYNSDNEHLYVITDDNNKLLMSIKKDGDVVFGINETASIKDGLMTYNDDKDYMEYKTDSEDRLIEAINIKGNKEIFGDLIVHGNILDRSRSKPKVICWGDSLFAGAGSDNLNLWSEFCSNLISKGFGDLSYRNSMDTPSMLQLLLGDKFDVLNCSVGGEDITTILARMGAELAYLPSDITLPTVVGLKASIVSGTNVGLGSKYRGLVYPLILGDGNSVNPVYVEGIECTIEVIILGYSATQYLITRNLTGDRPVTIPAGTPIIMKGSSLHKNEEIALLWCWQNGGYTDDADLVVLLNNAINSLRTKKYILVGLHSGNATTRAAQEELLEKTYGDKFFNWRRYVSSNAMYDFGLTPTSTDLSNMSVGAIPSSLLLDGIHLTAVGYSILGIKLYERMKNLAYI